MNYYVKKQHCKRALLGSIVGKNLSLSFKIFVFHIDEAMSKIYRGAGISKKTMLYFLFVESWVSLGSVFKYALYLVYMN